MEPTEYVFHIDEFTPDTLPMGRLAEYMASLAKMFGHREHTHFVRLEEGSVGIVKKVDAVDAPKVETRLSGLRVGSASKDALAGQHELETLLANDNAKANLIERSSGRVVLPFVGRDRPRPLVFPPFREDTEIVGQIVNIGGRDASAHATLQDGEIFHVNVSMKRELAKQLAPMLYGPPVRLFGNGKFERQEYGLWKMHDFRVDRYEIAADDVLGDVLARARDVPGNGLMDQDAYYDVAAVRGEADGE